MTQNTLIKSNSKTAKPIQKAKRITSNLVVPMDPELKKVVQAILAELGLNQSQLVVGMFKEVARTRKVPLSFDLNDKWSNARQATIEEAQAIEAGLASGFLTPLETENFLNEIGFRD